MEAESSHHVRLDHEPSLDVAFAVLQASPPVAVYHMRRCISTDKISQNPRWGARARHALRSMT